MDRSTKIVRRGLRAIPHEVQGKKGGKDEVVIFKE